MAIDQEHLDTTRKLLDEAISPALTSFQDRVIIRLRAALLALGKTAAEVEMIAGDGESSRLGDWTKDQTERTCSGRPAENGPGKEM